MRNTSFRPVIRATPAGACLFASALLFATFALQPAPVVNAAAPKAKFNRVLKIGDQAPEWGELPGVDGKEHGLGEYRDFKAVMVVFTCNHCPVAKAHEERLIALAKKYAEEAQVVAISVSLNPADSLERMRARSAEKQFPFPYLFDATQETGRKYGATVTPHVFLLDANRKIAYMGAFDDNSLEPEKAQRHYLADALEAVLAGREPPVKESLQRGCAIEYKSN